MSRYVCIHGHFYQPPRENPWFDEIEPQPSALPFHDWNERILAECYAPNAQSRLLDGEGRVRRMMNNYSGISFNFGPTLLSWMERKAPQTYFSIIDADRESVRRFSGHGSAIAQAYSHMILPLANRRDKETQVLWGIADFRYRFGRMPEGMWLPETAVDTQTLEVLAESGIGFTILAPRQAARVRLIGGREWHDVSGGRVDSRHVYRVGLPSGRSIVVFFYDGEVSREVAFDNLLRDGGVFAERLVSRFGDDGELDRSAQLVHIATDGETYGHHHRHGEMALSYALERVEEDGFAGLTNYGEFLERHPPRHEAEIIECTSWSCEHGLERWRSDCVCGSPQGHRDWSMAWRAPLRAALEYLRDVSADRFESAGKEFWKDPWAARNDYINLYGSEIKEQERLFKLLEAQRFSMLMFTSCGWFFEGPARIETTQCLRYADRLLELHENLFGENLEASFLAILAKSGDLHGVYRDCVRPARGGS